jgi:hypothetical protein
VISTICGFSAIEASAQAAAIWFAKYIIAKIFYIDGGSTARRQGQPIRRLPQVRFKSRIGIGMVMKFGAFRTRGLPLAPVTAAGGEAHG